MSNRKQFPKDFMWGGATAANQWEGCLLYTSKKLTTEKLIEQFNSLNVIDDIGDKLAFSQM